MLKAAGVTLSLPCFESLSRASDAASNEDDGYLVCMVYNQARDKSEIVLVDAQTMTEIAVVRLQQQIPFGFHGNFYPQVFKQGD